MRLATEKEIRKLKTLSFMCNEINKIESTRVKEESKGCKFRSSKDISFEFSNSIYISCEVKVRDITYYNGGHSRVSGAVVIYDDYALYDYFGCVVSLIRGLYRNGFDKYSFGRKTIEVEVIDYVNFKERKLK